jgi:GH24 family phage-related lysozyme (muramidase)
MAIPQSVLDRTKSDDFEGNIAWMYLDSLGKVTVGAGHRVVTEDAAAQLPFVGKFNGDPATSDAKKLDWNTIHLTQPGHQAAYYKNFAALRLEQNSVDAILSADMLQAECDLQDAFPSYDSFPDSAKEGLLDMMFNIGPTKFTKGNWPHFFAAVQATPPIWATAAMECHREDVNDARNDAVKRLFQQAAGL